MNFLHFFSLIAIIAIWGGNFVAIKLSLTEVPPIFLCFTRFLFSTIPAIFFIKKPSIPIKKIMLYSLVMFVLQFSFLFTAMRSSISPGLASVLLQLQSFFAIALSVLLLGEKFLAWQAAGACLAFSAIPFIIFHIGGDVSLLGICLILATAIMWACGNLMAKTLNGGFPLVVWGSLFATPPLLALSFILEGKEAIFTAIQRLSLMHISCIFYIAYGSTVLAFGVWNFLLQRYPLSKIAPFTLLVPMIGMWSSSLIFGEELHWWKMTATGLILGGLCIHLFGERLWKMAAPDE